MVEITYDIACEFFEYDSNTGFVYWKKTSNPRAKSGQRAGASRKDGYRVISLKKQTFLEHRLIWFLINKTWPTKFLDHIDGNPANNKIENLREATPLENQQNQKHKRKNNTSGYLGVSWHNIANKWKAEIRSNNKPIYLGLFDNPDEAYKAYLVAKQSFHTFNPTL